MCTLNVSKVIYHKVSQSIASCTVSVKNVKVMLEFVFLNKKLCLNSLCMYDIP